MPGRVLEPTWAQPAAQNAPRISFDRCFVDLGPIFLILERSLVDFDGFLMPLVLTFKHLREIVDGVGGCRSLVGGHWDTFTTQSATQFRHN